MDRFLIVTGDITKSDAVAIVNPVSISLAGINGVDGAIHRAAGPALHSEYRSLPACVPGCAELTAGYNLRAHFVLHTTGPVWQGGGIGEPLLLASCYRSCLELAAAHQLKSIDFPPLSVGLYRYPIMQAAFIAVETIMAFLKRETCPERVRIVCEDDATASVFYQAYLTWCICSSI